MGITTWPCAGCGQQQSTTHQNGEAPALRLCAACEEKRQLDAQTEVTSGKKPK